MHISTNEPHDPTQTPWERIVQKKLRSNDELTRNSHLVGLAMDTKTPVFVPRETLDVGHYHVRGRTGSGKTAAALLSFALQILRRNKSGSDQESPKSPLIIFDLKGDQAFFNAIWEAALRDGRTFRYLSTRKGDDYHFFDPFQMFRLGHLLPVQLATEFIRAFSLDYGLIYGGLYFTHQNLDILRQAIEEMLAQPKPELTIDTLARILRRLARTAKNNDSRHIESCLNLLAAYPQVNVKLNQAADHQTIDMRRALDHNEVLYFFMQMEGEAPSLRQVASLALYSLLEAAKHRYYRGQHRKRTYVIIDEFYHIAGKSFGEFLSTVRGWGLHLVLANQSMEQLSNHDRSLPEMVSSNISVEQAFTLRPDDEEYFRAASGEKIEFLNSYATSNINQTWTASESKTTFLSDLDAKKVHDTSLASLMIINDGKAKGPGQRVLKVQGLFPHTFQAYQRYERSPFPQRPLDAIAQPDGGPSSRTTATKPNDERLVNPELASFEQRMATKWDELRASELRQT